MPMTVNNSRIALTQYKAVNLYTNVRNNALSFKCPEVISSPSKPGLYLHTCRCS